MYSLTSFCFPTSINIKYFITDTHYYTNQEAELRDRFLSGSITKEGMQVTYSTEKGKDQLLEAVKRIGQSADQLWITDFSVKYMTRLS